MIGKNVVFAILDILLDGAAAAWRYVGEARMSRGSLQTGSGVLSPTHHPPQANQVFDQMVTSWLPRLILVSCLPPTHHHLRPNRS